MDYTGIEALDVKSCRLKGDRGELQSVCRTRTILNSLETWRLALKCLYVIVVTLKTQLTVCFNVQSDY